MASLKTKDRSFNSLRNLDSNKLSDNTVFELMLVTSESRDQFHESFFHIIYHQVSQAVLARSFGTALRAVAALGLQHTAK